MLGKVARKSFVEQNFLAILAFGVMFLAVFVAMNPVGTSRTTVTRADGPAAGR
jgi:hypothetical protein